LTRWRETCREAGTPPRRLTVALGTEVEVLDQAIGLDWMHCAYVSEVDESGAVRGIIAVITDVTARKFAEEQREASLREKDVLLRTVHHRVKDNLQIIFGLLHLQADSCDDPQVRSAFEDNQDRESNNARLRHDAGSGFLSWKIQRIITAP
jgi:signal transduction histidine kinase